ncbi:MAG: methylcobalamin:coenzyme M methyltransferase [candidate division BRC1 bacterium ADurb.BinA364]|nr:MAG: methylcobalamin:coenzyme M methyltransferase [candidate division BRC1 bacterium ADurb.BinA364]
MRRKAVNYGGGFYNEIEFHPLAGADTIEELKTYGWPSADWFDYEAIPDLIRQTNATGGPYAIIALNCNVFETAWHMRGLERTMLDLALNPEQVDFILGKVADFYLEQATRTLQAARGAIDLVFTADDIGQQKGLLMSLDMWARHIKPHHARINKAIHEYGARAIYHSDGAVMDAVPGLIDMGIDILQALQFDAEGMDARALKDRFGERLCFQGGVSVQRTLPFGEPNQVRREVESLIRSLGRDGGYILGPSHAIQAGTPAENVYAMFEAALHFSRNGGWQ